MNFFEGEIKKKDLPQSSQQLVLYMARIWGDFIGDSIEKQSLKVLCVPYYGPSIDVDHYSSTYGLKNVSMERICSWPAHIRRSWIK